MKPEVGGSPTRLKGEPMSSRICDADAESPAVQPCVSAKGTFLRANGQARDDASPEAAPTPLTDVLRESAGQFISQAMQVELDCYLERSVDLRTERGRLAIVRNGFHPERSIVTGIGPVRVRIPKVRSRNARPFVFRSAVLPPYTRLARRLDPALLALYAHGISSGDVDEVLTVLVGPRAAGLPVRLKRALSGVLMEQREAWRSRPLQRESWVELWADGVCNEARAGAPQLCILVVIGGNEHGAKRLLTVQQGACDSAKSWRSVLLELQARGLELPPRVVGGSSARGFRAAVNALYPRTKLDAAAQAAN